ncbi:MAG: protein-tyrosine phosphatase family protein [Candidatus Hydrogenedentota bacterium]
MGSTTRTHATPLLRYPVLLLVVFTTLFSTGCARLGANLQEVDPNAYYRSGQMNAVVLSVTLEWYDIKTVVNLRGESPDDFWYRNETAVCAKQGVEHHDLDWTMRRPPEPESLQTFISIVSEAEQPMLVHCQGGVHRAAVAAACYRLLQGDSIEEAREEFGILFCDAPIGQVFDLYEQSDLYEQDGNFFEQWVSEEYPAQYQALGYDEEKDNADAVELATSTD